MRKILAILMIFVAAESLAQFSPTFDTVRLRRGGRVYEVITYGEDSVKINGVMYRFDPATIGGWWQESGPAIMPDPSGKVLKYPGIPTTYGPNLPGSYSPVYWDAVTGYMAKFSRTGGGGVDPIDGDTITGCGGVYVNTVEAADIALNVDSIANICGCFVIKNMGVGSTVTLTSIEGLLFDTLSSVVLDYGEWASICADSTFFVTFGTIDLAPRNGMWPLYYERDTIKINKASASDSGYLTSADWTTFNGRGKLDTVFANIVDYGAVGDGITDCTAAFASALATKKMVWVPHGTFVVDSIVLSSYDRIMGVGMEKSIVKLNTGKRVCIRAYSINNISISNLSLEGGTKIDYTGSESEGNRIGIDIFTVKRSSFNNLYIYGFDKVGIYTHGNNNLMNHFTDLTSMYNYTGIDIADLSEYSTYTGIGVRACKYGMKLTGGNNLISGLSALWNVVGLYMYNCSNPAHGSIVNSNFNHNKQYSIIIDTVQTLGQLFSSCNFWFGGMKIDNSPLIRFDNCRVEVDSIRFVGECAGSGFHNSFFNPSISPFVRDRATDFTYFQNNTYTDQSTANWSAINDPYPLMAIDNVSEAVGAGDTILSWNPLTKNIEYKIGGGGGSVTSISQGTGMLFSTNPNPITTTGTIGVDTSKVVMFNDTLTAGKMQTKYAARNHVELASPNPGDIIYRNSLNNAWNGTAPASAGLYLTSIADEGAFIPRWDTLPAVADSMKNPWKYSGGYAINRSAVNFGIGTTTPVSEFQVASTSSTAPRGIMSSQHSTGTGGAMFSTRKSRGTNASPTVITTADTLGSWWSRGHDGTNYVKSAAIDMVSSGTIGTNRMPSYMAFSTATDAAPSVLTERMRITAAGRLGIGTTAPGYLLDVAGAIHSTNAVYASSALAYMVVGEWAQNYNGVAYLENISSGANSALGFKTKNAETMRLTPSGNLGIGTTAPNAKLHVVTTAANDTAARFWSINTSSNNYGLTSYGDLHGIKAKGYTGRGVWGIGATAGLYGEGGLYGVLGSSGSTAGVRGESTAGDGVQGYSSASGKYGGYFTSLYKGKGLFASTATVDSQLIVNRKATTDTAVIKKLIYTPCNTGNITAGTGITAAMLCADMRYNGNSAVDITSNPQIADGVDGQTISITCLSSTNTLRIDNGNGVQLDGGVDYTMLEGYNITLRYISSMDKWVEISRNQHYWGEP